MVERVTFNTSPDSNLFAPQSPAAQPRAPLWNDLSVSPNGHQQDPLAQHFGNNNVQIRAGKQTHRVTDSATSPVSTSGTARINMADAGNGEAGLLSTAQHQGSPVTATNLKPSDTLRIGNVEFSVEVAERIGLIRKDPVSGGYVNANAEETKAVLDPEPKEQKDPRTEDPHFGQSLGEAADGALHELTHATTAGTQMRGLLNIVENGEVSASTLASAASEASIEPHEMAARIGPVVAAFRAQFDALARDSGVDPTDFASWANSHEAGAIKDAMLKHGRDRTTAGYVPLFQKYLEQYDVRSPNSILGVDLGSGIKSFKGTDGRVVLQWPDGKQVPWSVAVKTGMIAPRIRR